MIYQTTYNTKKICYLCVYLELKYPGSFEGKCTCPDNKIKNRERDITDRRCSYKRIYKEAEASMTLTGHGELVETLGTKEDKL